MKYLMDIKLLLNLGWKEGGYTKVYVSSRLQFSKAKMASVIVGKTPDVEDAVFVDMINMMEEFGCGQFKKANKKGEIKNYFKLGSLLILKDFSDASTWNTQGSPASDGLNAMDCLHSPLK